MLQNMGKVKKIVLLVEIIVIILCVGIWGGIQVENSRALKQNSIDLGYKTEIAVVNLDEGAISNGSMVYYSKSLVDSLAANFHVVSMQVAEAGLANGTYGGMVVIPADLSKNVISINSTNINTAVLQYKINNKLPEAKYIAVYESICNIQNAISNSFRYIYIASIIQTTHRGQQSAEQIFLNDQQDLEELNKLRNTNFMQGLSHIAIPEISTNFESISISDFSTRVTGYQDALTGKYSDLYKAAVKAYADDEQAILDQSVLIKGIVSDWLDEMDGYIKIAIDDQTALSEYKDDLDAYKDELDAYKDELDAWIAAGGTETAPTAPTFSSAAPVLAFTQIDFSIIKNDYMSDIDATIIVLEEIVTRHSSQEMYEDPTILKNIKDIVSDFSKYVSDVVKEFNDLQLKNEITLKTGISDAKKYASDVYSDAEKKYSEDKARLTLALNTFYSRKYATSQSNKELLSEFAKMLPYSRNGELINQEFVNGIVTPIEMKGNPYREQGNDSGESRARIQTILFIVVAVLALAALILWFTAKRKQRERDKVLAYRN